MKNFICISMSLFLMFFLSGCVQHSVSFEPKAVEATSVQYISNKLQSLTVGVKKMPLYSFEKRPTSVFIGKGVLLSLDSKFNEHSLRSVLSQYFNYVDYDTSNNHDLYIETKLLDFDWEPDFGGQASVFKLNISAFYKNKEILNKNYVGSFKTHNIVASFLSGKELTNYIKSKDLFELYQTQFIPDLALALKQEIK